MLLEIAVGDAFGACYEWTEKWIIGKYLMELRYITLKENPSLIKPGNYTDDTQMTIALAEFMLENKKWSHDNIADKFVECFHRDPRRGYAPGFYTFLLDHKNGADFVKDIRPNSNRSGAAMRAAPLGLIKDLGELKKKSIDQSTLTHNTSEGVGSALCAASMVHYFKYELGPKSDLLNWLDRLFPMPWLPISVKYLKNYKEHIPVEGWPCVMAAIDAILRSDSLSEVLVNSVKFAGDTDTIAAIAMGPASFCKEIKQDLPQNLVDGLENGKYGRDYLVTLDKKLMEKYD